MSKSNSLTPLSLLERIRANDQDAWFEFSGRYARILEKWCQAWRIQATDAQDIIQDTLIAVMNGIEGFRRRGPGSFRAWMKTIAWRIWCETLAKAERREDRELLHWLKNSPDAYQNLEREFDRLALQELLETSMERAQARVEEKTWQAFRMTALEARPASEVAELLSMRVDAVYAARCRVQRLVTEEYSSLDEA